MQPESLPLVEAQVPGVGRGRCHPHRGDALGGEQRQGCLHQPPAEALSLQLFADGHVLDLGPAGLAGAGQLQVPHDPRPAPGHQDPPGMQVGVQLGG
ncbi:MAG TPA: hypothetical protein VGD91_23555 [Trebonia sp.]